MILDRATHWDDRYSRVGSSRVSWYDPDLHVSLQLLGEAGAGPGDSVVDVGGGASSLTDHLLDRGLTDLTVVDVSAAALDESQARLAGRAPAAHVDWVHADLLDWHPHRRWDVWHDRAVFHFLTQPDQVDAYRGLAARSVVEGGHLVVGTFGPQGPLTCSGLPVARYSSDELAHVFADQFELTAAVAEDHMTPSGDVQQFSWVLLRRRSG